MRSYEYKNNIVFIENYEVLGFESVSRVNELKNNIGDFFFKIINNRKEIIEILNSLIKESENMSEELLGIYNYTFFESLPFEKLYKIDSMLNQYIERILRTKISKKSKEKSDKFAEIESYKKRVKLLKSIKDEKDVENYLNNYYFKESGVSSMDSRMYFSLTNNLSEAKENLIQYELEHFETEIKFAEIDLKSYSPDFLKTEVIKELENIKNVINLCYSSLIIFQNINLKKEQFERTKQQLLLNLSIPKQKYIFYKEKTSNKIEFLDSNDSMMTDIKKLKWGYSYITEDFNDIMSVYIDYFIKKTVRINKCPNCNKVFIPHNKQVYCNNRSPQNPNKACIELSDDIRNNDNQIQKVYRNYYKKAHSIVCNNYKQKKDVYEIWSEEAKKLKNKYKENTNLKIENFEKEMKEMYDKYMKK